MAIELPIEKTKANRTFDSQKILIYGRAKIGKSTLCSRFEKPLFLATESGLNHLDVYRINIRNWEMFLEACGKIQEGKHDFKTVIIDTVDNLVTMCQDYICRKYEINHPADMPHGKGWNFVTTELDRVMTKLSVMPYGLVMISHCDIEEIETKTKKFNRFTISVSGKNRKIFVDMADIILFIDSEMDRDGTERRIIRTKPSLYWEAGDRANLLPETIQLSYDELVKFFKLKEDKGGIENASTIQKEK